MTDSALEITNLLYTYAEVLDGGDMDAVAALFEHGRICGMEDGPPETVFSGSAIETPRNRKVAPDGSTKWFPLTEMRGSTPAFGLGSVALLSESQMEGAGESAANAPAARRARHRAMRLTGISLYPARGSACRG